MTVPAVLSLVTLGVRDVAASTAFYRSLGFPLSSSSVDGDVSFFRTAGGLLGLYGAQDLRRDASADPDAASATDTAAANSFRGVTLAINVATSDVVDASLAAASAAGARIVKAAQGTEWGGYHGYFADPDGHLWEVAHNPFWPLDDRGVPELPA